MKTLCHTTAWKELKNHVILHFDPVHSGILHGNPYDFPVGIIEVTTFHAGKRKGTAYIWNLHVNDECRGKGYGQHLLDTAIREAVKKGCHTAELDWSSLDSPEWVLRWYLRQGFTEAEFGNKNVLLRKELK